MRFSHFHLLLLILVVIVAVSGLASGMRFRRQLVGGERAQKPKYLDIEGWKKCMDNKQVGEAHNVWCFPDEKPGECQQSSWDQLKALGDNDSPSTCASIS